MTCSIRYWQQSKKDRASIGNGKEFSKRDNPILAALGISTAMSWGEEQIDRLNMVSISTFSRGSFMSTLVSNMSGDMRRWWKWSRWMRIGAFATTLAPGPILGHIQLSVLHWVSGHPSACLSCCHSVRLGLLSFIQLDPCLPVYLKLMLVRGWLL